MTPDPVSAGPLDGTEPEGSTVETLSTPSQSPTADPLQQAITEGTNESIQALPAIRSQLRDQEANDRTLSTFATDIPLGVAQGVRDFQISTTGLFTRLTTGEDIGSAQSMTRTWTGDVADSVTQFLYGAIPANRVIRAVGLAAKGYTATNALVKLAVRGANWINTETKVAGVARAAVSGVPAQFVGFDEHEERLSNTLQHMPVLGKPVFSYLAASPDDSWAEARLKNTVEGLGLGLATDGLLLWLKGLKKAAVLEKAGDAVGANKVLAESVQQGMDNEQLRTLIDQFGKSAPNVSQDQLLALQRGWVSAIHGMNITVEDYLSKYSIRAIKAGEELPGIGRLPAKDALPLEAGGIPFGSSDIPLRSAEKNALPLEELPAPVADVAPFARTVGEPPVPGPSRKSVDVGLKGGIELAEPVRPVSPEHRAAVPSSDSIPLYTEPPKVHPPFTLTLKGPEGKDLPVKYATREAATDDVWEMVKGTDAVDRVQAALIAGEKVNVGDTLPSSLRGQSDFVTEVVRTKLGIPDKAVDPTGFAAFKRRYRAGINTLYQTVNLEDAPRGQVDFVGETQALISFFRGADVSTIWHESFHVWRRFGMPSEMEEGLAKAFNVAKDSKGKYLWTVEAEEAAAKQFESYLASGKAVTAETRDAFKNLSTWLKAIYQGVDNSPLAAEVSPEAREVFEKLMSGKPVVASKTAAPVTDLAVSKAGDVLYQRGRFSVPQRQMDKFATALKKAQTSEEVEEAVNDSVKTWVNYNRMAITQDAEGVLKGAQAAIEEQFQAHVGQRVTLKNAGDLALKLAEDWAMDGRGLMSAVKDAKGAEGVAVRLIAYRNLLVTTAEDAARIASLIRDGKAGDMTWEKYTQEVLRPFVALRYQVKAIETEAARTVSLGRVMARRLTTQSGASQFGNVDVNQMLSVVERVLRSGGTDADKLLTQITSAGTDATRLSRVFRTMELWSANKTAIARSWALEWWMNSILSGARTLTTNPITQVFTTFLNPAERVVGGVIRGTVLKDPQAWAMAKSGLRMYWNLGESLLDSVRHLNLSGELAMPDGTVNPLMAGWRSLRTETPLLTHLTSAENDIRAITRESASEFFGVDPSHVLARATGFIGSVVRVPSRVLSSTDEVIKQLNYRSYIRDLALREGHEVVGNDPKLLADYVANFMRDAWDSTGAGKLQQGIDYAEKITFTQKLKPGGLGEGISNLANNVPGMRLIFPFVRTPTNVIRTAVTYTPGINLITGELKQALFHGSPEAKADAAGRLAMSGVLLGSAMYLCVNGQLTGAGPQDQRERELLQSTGWRPFSFVKLNDDGSKTYIGYNRLDPLAIPLGIIADLNYYHREVGERDRKAIQDSLLLAVAHQIQSKSYLSGLGMVVSAASGDERAVQKLTENFAGSFLVPNAVSQQGIPLAGAEGSEYLQEAHNFSDAIFRRIPGYNNPKRNVLGEPIPRNTGFEDYDSGLWNSLSPVAFSNSVDDSVKQEMVSLGHSFTAPAKRYKTIDLTTIRGQGDQTAYDRLLELRGKTFYKNKTLSEALNALVKSQKYQGIPKDETEAGSDTPKRARLIAEVISEYHAGAMKQVLKEFPEIQQMVKAKSVLTGNTRSTALLDALTK